MNKRDSIWAEVLFFFGALLLGAAVGSAAFLFAIDKYVAVIPVAVPVEIPCSPNRSTPPPPTKDLKKGQLLI
jgi:hypothetical protein